MERLNLAAQSGCDLEDQRARAAAALVRHAGRHIPAISRLLTAASEARSAMEDMACRAFDS